MQDLQNIVKEILKKDDRFISQEGDLLKNIIREQAEKLDENLITLLLENKKTREVFFKPIKDVIVFDSKKFIQFLNNKEFLADSYTSFKNKIGLTNEKLDFISDSNEIVLSFPYKDGILAGGQDKEDSKRDEIFYNEILGSDDIDRLLDEKVFTNFKKFNKDGEQKVTGFNRDEDGTIKDNLIIKGNNLLALHSLKSNFAGKIKLIYIDPPYNTGADSFGYNDSFNHSTWLTFMKNRFEIAKLLLSDDGIISVQCSFHEKAYLEILMNEIFCNHLFNLNIKVRHTDRILTGDKEFNDVIEYNLIYSKNINKKIPKKIIKKTEDDYIYKIIEIGKPEVIDFKGKKVKIFIPDNYKVEVVKGKKDNFKKISIRGTIREKNSSGRFYVKYIEDLINNYPPETLFLVPNIGDDDFDGRYFYTPSKGKKNGGYYQGFPNSSNFTEKPYANFIDLTSEYNNVGYEGDVSFRNGKKPEELIRHLISIFVEKKDDIILDYHLGSGTTCSVAQKMGIQYIGVEQMDYIEDVTVKRMKKVIDGEQGGISKNVDWKGGGEFVYMEIMKSNERFIDKIQKTKTIKELLNIYEEIKESGFINYNIDIQKIDENISEFEKLSLENMKKFLMELLDMNMLYVNYSEIEDESYGVSGEDRKMNREFYK